MSRLIQKVRVLRGLYLMLLVSVLYALTAMWSNKPVDTSDQERGDFLHVRFDSKLTVIPQTLKNVDSAKDVADNSIQTDVFSLLTFIPRRAPVATLNCIDLFVKSKATTFKMSSEYHKKKDQFLDALETTSKKYPQVEGHSFQLDEQHKALHFMAGLKFVRNICETGFHAGHSSFNFLTANLDAIVHSFDIGHWNITAEMARIVSDMFPGRFFIHFGDSVKSVPEFISQSPNYTCDLLFIDGGHSNDVAKADIWNFASIANLKNNLVIFDDYPTAWGIEFGLEWENSIRLGFIEEAMRCHYIPNLQRGFTIGRVVKRPDRNWK